MDQLCFDYSVQEIEQTVQRIISETRAFYDTIGSRSLPKVSFDNTVRAVSIYRADLDILTGPIIFLQHVSPTKKVRDASRKAEEALEELWTELGLRTDIYERYLHIQRTVVDLDPIDQRLLDENIKTLRRQGLDLSQETRERYQKLRGELDKLQIKFNEIIAEDDSHLFFTPAQLDGMPDDFIQRTYDSEHACHKITHDYPDVFPILNLCKVRETRQAVYQLYANRVPQNFTTLISITSIRREIAILLDYPDWATFQLDQTMAKTPQRVLQLFDSLQTKLTPFHLEYTKRLEQLAGHELKVWDQYYYKTMLLRTDYNVDPEEIRPYFPLEYTISSMLELYSELFSLRIEPVEVSVWHKDVRNFVVRDAGNNDLIGYFAMDLFPRDGKYSHAAMWDLVPGHRKGDQRIYPIASLVCNFTPDTPDQPSLLTHYEVETMYHEFGHVIHGLCGGYKSEYADFSGARVKTDFVEAPSQMIEQWLMSFKVLARISHHYKTGEPLPQKMIDRLIAAKNLGEPTDWLRQCYMSHMSLYMHQHPTREMLETVWNDLQLNYMSYTGTPINFLASWTHLGMDEYSASYYSYIWSVIIAADLYSRFRDDPLSKTVGFEYRRQILEPGGSREPDDLTYNYLDRDISLNSFLESIGAVNNI